MKRLLILLFAMLMIASPVSAFVGSPSITYSTSVRGHVDVCYDASLPSAYRAAIFFGASTWSYVEQGDTLLMYDGGNCSGTPGVNWNLRYAWGDWSGSGCTVTGQTVLSNPTGYYTYATVYLDSPCVGLFYTANDTNVPSDKISLRMLAKHEAGHAIGLGHVSGNEIMNPSYCCTPGQYHASIGTDDRAGLQALY